MIQSNKAMKKITTIILTALLVLTYSCKQGAEEGSDQEQDAIANAAKRCYSECRKNRPASFME